MEAGTLVQWLKRPGDRVHRGDIIAIVDTQKGAIEIEVYEDGVIRSGSLRSSELSDPTITVTNLGDMGVESAFGVIYPPQVALVAFGKIVDRPWIVAGRVEARPLLTASLSADHRAVDGHRGGLFLAAVGRLLQEPERP